MTVLTKLAVRNFSQELRATPTGQALLGGRLAQPFDLTPPGFTFESGSPSRPAGTRRTPWRWWLRECLGDTLLQSADSDLLVARQRAFILHGDTQRTFV